MVTRWFRGDANAVALFETIAYATQVADDIVDEDLEIEDRAGRMAKLFTILVMLPSNPFYAQFYAQLHPLICAGVMEWEASNSWQRSPSRETRLFGYVKREALESLVTYCAHLIGGPDWAMQVTREVHQFYHVDHADGETFESWCGEVFTAEAAE